MQLDRPEPIKVRQGITGFYPITLPTYGTNHQTAQPKLAAPPKLLTPRFASESWEVPIRKAAAPAKVV